MSIDKTLRLTVESGSQITSYLDSALRITISQFPDLLLGQPKLSSSHSLKNLRAQTSRYTELEYQNQLLRNQISALKKQLKSQRDNRNNIVAELDQEIFKLKKLIQKSYYSLKGLENQNIKLNNQKYEISKKEAELQNNLKLIEQKNRTMYEYITEIKKNHGKEMSLIWERVAHLQKNLETVVKIIQQDRTEEKLKKKSRTSISASSSEKNLKLNYY